MRLKQQKKKTHRIQNTEQQDHQDHHSSAAIAANLKRPPTKQVCTSRKLARLQSRRDCGNQCCSYRTCTGLADSDARDCRQHPRHADQKQTLPWSGRCKRKHLQNRASTHQPTYSKTLPRASPAEIRKESTLPPKCYVVLNSHRSSSSSSREQSHRWNVQALKQACSTEDRCDGMILLSYCCKQRRIHKLETFIEHEHHDSTSPTILVVPNACMCTFNSHMTSVLVVRARGVLPVYIPDRLLPLPRRRAQH